MDAEPSVGRESYIKRAQEFLRQFSNKLENQESPRLPPIERFFAALAKSEAFSRFINIVDLKTNLPIDKWRYAHYYSAFVYALRTTEEGRRFIQEKNFDLFSSVDINKWDKALELVFNNQQLLEVFKRSTERPMQSTAFYLTIPVRLVLNKLFENKNNIIGYDLGCGLHIDLPILASNYLPEEYRFPSNDIQKYNQPIAILRGYGLDLNPPDIEWVKACTSALCSTKEEASKIEAELDYLVGLRSGDPNKFPFIEGDLFNFQPSPSDKLADFVLTKKMRYQHPDEKQDEIKTVITRILKEGGYWITVAEEDYFTDSHEKYLQKDADEIWVYQKINGKLVRFTDTPVIEINRRTGQISSFDAGFFWN